MFFFASALPLPAFAQSSAAPAKADAVEYHATIDNAKYVFGVAPPVAHVKAGNILEANSLDCFCSALPKQSSELASRMLPALTCATGGATPKTQFQIGR